jgi:hypothetical protein
VTRARNGREATGIDSLQVTYVGRTPEWGLRAAQAVWNSAPSVSRKRTVTTGYRTGRWKPLKKIKSLQRPTRLATPLAINIGRDQEVRRWPASSDIDQLSGVYG